LYSSVNNHDTSKSILSLYELIAIIIVFFFLLYLLFPKKNISHLVDTQASHTNLSVNYLESLVLYYPDNIELKFTLIDKYTQLADYRKALDLTQQLIRNNEDKKLLTKLYTTEYLLEKNLYFQKQNNRKLKKLKKKLLALYEYTKGNRDTLFFFGESTNIDHKYLKYESLIAYLEENPEEANYNLEKMAYDLANELNYPNKALQHLEALVKYPNTQESLNEYLIYTLFEKGDHAKAKEITTQLFLQSQTDDELSKHFHLALYALVKDENRSTTEVRELIQTYASLKTLLDPDISIVIESLLELGEMKEASNFILTLLDTSPESFGANSMEIAIQSLLYNSQLYDAQRLSLFALDKFKSKKYLDKSIEISTWMSDDEKVQELNTQGYQRYQSEPYLSYFLHKKDLNKDHAILGQIYEAKINQREYDFIDKMARYFNHTGEIPKAQHYFKQLNSKTQQPKALYYAVEFAHHNSDFDESLTLYKKYRTEYGQAPKLQQLCVQGLMALKRFEEAYLLTKTLLMAKVISPTKHKTVKNPYHEDLAWLAKDYAYLYRKLWRLETQNALTAQQFTQLILLEKALNQGEKLSYLYEKSWKQNNNSYHLSDLLYKLLKAKKFTHFDEVITSLTPSQKESLKSNSYYQELLAEYYVQIDKIHLALETYDTLLKLNPQNTIIHQNYLWLLLDNIHTSPFLEARINAHLKLLEHQHLLRDTLGIVGVVAAMSQKKYELSKSWIKRLIAKKPNQQEYQALYQDLQIIEKELLYIEYSKMLDPYYLKTHLALNKKHYGSQLKRTRLSVKHQWQLYQKIKAKMTLEHYHYNAKNTNKKQEKQTSLALSLSNREDNFLWDLQIGMLETDKSFLKGSLDLSQQINNVNLNLKARYHDKTELTPHLAQHALENVLTLNLRTDINKKTSITLQAKKSEFIGMHEENTLGTATQFKLLSNYVLRSGYPDISFNTYLGHHQFSKRLAQDFSEIGFAASAGKIRQHTLNHSWKPFGTVILAVND